MDFMDPRMWIAVLLIAPFIWLLALGLGAQVEGDSATTEMEITLTEFRAFFAYYAPFAWCALPVTLGANPVMVYAISAFAAYVASAHWMDRSKKPIWHRLVWSLLSFVLIGYVLYKSDLFTRRLAHPRR
jgi:hypothetical protein